MAFGQPKRRECLTQPRCSLRFGRLKAVTHSFSVRALTPSVTRNGREEIADNVEVFVEVF
jgi:hypothetical protein